MATILPFFIAMIAVGEANPHLVETKVQTDLENGLSKMITKDLFLVQVHTEITTRSERKLVEGESVIDSEDEDPQPEQVEEPMPGFVPEPDPPGPKKKGPRLRQIFKVVDVPELQMVRVLVNFDETVAAPIVGRSKVFTQNYLREGFPGKSTVIFNVLPMLKPSPTPTPSSVAEFDDEDMEEEGFEFPVPPPVMEEKKEPGWQEKIWDAKWFFLALLGALLYFVLRWRALSVRALVKKTPPAKESSDISKFWPWLAGGAFPGGFPPFNKGGGEAKPEEEVDEEEVKRERRSKLLEKFLSRSQAFRGYYSGLSGETKDELYGLLKGPTMDGLLTGLGLPRPKGEIPEPGNPEEAFTKYERDFTEYLNACDWQNKQFFGFLQALSDEQLIALMNRESTLSVCAMLRFLKASQSAMVLEAMPPGRRLEVLAQVPAIQNTSFSDIANIEREVRTSVQMMPSHSFGAKRQDVDFWGNVLAESQNQDVILGDLEKTNPEIYPELSKFKFKLEDVSTLPDSLLQTILAEADNEELAMALSTCPDDIVEVILDAISPRRQELLRQTIDAAKSAPKEQTKSARISLTKKFREAMA
jgi:hypothetical protein